MTGYVRAIVTSCLLAPLTAGCGSHSANAPAVNAGEQPAPQPAARAALQPVALPDLSGAAASVVADLNQRYEVLAKKIAVPATPAADLAAAAYGDLGKLLMAAEYRDSAEPCLLDAQALAPGDVRWPYYLGHLYRLRGETARSAMSFERAVELKPDEEAALVWLGGTYLDLARPDDAERLFMKVRSLKPQSAAGVFGLGHAALAKKDYSNAATYLEQTLALDPTASIVHYRLALAYRGLGRMADAEAQFAIKGDREVALTDPLFDELSGAVRSQFSYEHLGVEAMNRRDYPAAIGYFRRGVELAPDDPSLRHRLGTALALSGDGRGAVAEYREVLRRTPTFASTHYTLGVLVASSGRYAEAIDQFAAAVKANPGYVEAHLQLAETLRRSGRPQDSLPHYEQAAALDPRLADAVIGHAMALAALRRCQDARDRLSEGMARYPGRPAIAHAMVRLLAAAPDDRVRDGNRAIAIAQEWLDREPPNPDLGEATAMAMAEAGRYDEAVLWQQRAIAIAERAGRGDLAKRMAENLGLFERHQPSRRPWHEDDSAASGGL